MNDRLAKKADSGEGAGRMGPSRFIGIDVGAETIKIAELVSADGAVRVARCELVEHHKAPEASLLRILADWDWERIRGAAVCGRLSRVVDLPRIPAKQAITLGYRYFFQDRPGTVVSLGNHGFSVLELRASGLEVLRENSRCAQGTGNFLRQLVERFSLTIEEASELCAEIENPAPLSGRCPVILKTDMTHLANKGEERSRILAGLFDAVCQNVFSIIKPGVTPPDVTLIGGVSRSRRVRRVFESFLDQCGMRLRCLPDDRGLFLEAIGAALAAAEAPAAVPQLTGLVKVRADRKLEQVPALGRFLDRVKRNPAAPWAQRNGRPLNLILGFDIGSTGSKLVALDSASSEAAWEGYTRTCGDPIGAAQRLLTQYLQEHGAEDPVVCFGVTGSGREIVGSLLLSCFDESRVFILNEIAAHAEGALHYDPRVDTIFEIGGQDAKYIRLEEGRIVDSAMNEACSAGTGSFIEEQGQRFSGFTHISHMSAEAMQAQCGISLGQHCSVFMAEIIDEAVAAGEDRKTILAGLYDSVIQNYLHRVKGNRSVGKVIFCQGMPFAADALAAAVARQTGGEVIIPPNPGTVGALGIALLARRALGAEYAPLDPARFLRAKIENKEIFICKSTKGCGGTGNLCRIDSIRTVVEGTQQRFTWGGSCSLYDKGARKKKLPDLSPDPFREREDLARSLTEPSIRSRGRKTVSITREFVLSGLFPFFTSFIHELGLDPRLFSSQDQDVLKRGIRQANVPFCAPMQLYHGVAGLMADEPPDFVFMPMIRGIQRNDGDRDAATCPILQGSCDILRWDLKQALAGKIISTLIDMGKGNLRSPEFMASCGQLASDLGIHGASWRAAHAAAAAVQDKFEEGCMEIGRRAIEFCAARSLPLIVVLGRPYTIHNTILNSNVPAVLREQGMLALPLDCYPVEGDVPAFDSMYWGYGQKILRAAHQIRRAPRTYAVYCSNYSCGPDSFNLHFCGYILEGKPFAVIETDGHSGDAGTRTRIEAFLYCVAGDSGRRPNGRQPNSFLAAEPKPMALLDVEKDECILVAGLGPSSEIAAAAFRGLGLRSEVLPDPDAEMLKLGRRHTSGKECVPLILSLGSLLGRLQAADNPQERFVLLMPSTRGPCRFGVYHVLNQITLERLGWKDRVRIFSPVDSNYFANTPAGFPGLFLGAAFASDVLQAALLETRPAEKTPGAAARIYQRYRNQLLNLVAEETKKRPSLADVIWQVSTGRLFGMADLLRNAVADLASERTAVDLPAVAVVGEIYVRLNPFANDSVIDRLESKGIRARLAPFCEWLEYLDYLSREWSRRQGIPARLQLTMRKRILRIFSDIYHRRMGSHFQVPVPESIRAAGDYLSKDLWGEAVLTLGSGIAEWRQQIIQGIVNVGPLECMPTKIAEAQYFHVSEQEKVPVLTLEVNGDPIDPQVLDDFACEVRSRAASRL